MKVPSFIVVFALLPLAFSSFSAAYDPSPLQDFCVAADDPHSAVLVNGKLCKDPNRTTPDDFLFSGLNVPASTSNTFGSNVTLLTVDVLPGANTLGVSMGRIDFAPSGGLNPPHNHPRASEILLVLEGSLYVGFITTNPHHRVFSKILHAGDVFVFPLGMIHFQLNVGNTKAVAIVSFNSQNPGVMTLANALFGCHPSILPDVLTSGFQLDYNLVENLQKQEWVNNDVFLF